ncbi:MAG: methyltransferase domain-containing protein [Candidatus Thorarchaeota archaeon]|nr:MAG: methyltransferase domain-containing protein [Candidatus Thorarchaeota archaeon]
MSPADFLFPGVHWVLEILLVVFLALFLWICICARSVRYFWKFPAPAAAGRLIGGPQRKRIQPPSMIVDALVLSPGMKILELGCGPGTFTLDIARAVQPDGTVYAVDIQEGMLEQLRSRMKREQVENVIPILADAEVEIPLSDGSMDAAFAVTVLPEIPDPVKALQQVKRLLKDGGCFADAELMIDPDYPLRRTVIKWATKAGFTFRSKSGNAFRYVLVFQSESQ